MLTTFVLLAVLFTHTLAIAALVKNKFSKAAVYNLLSTSSFALWAVTNVAAEQYGGDTARNTFFNQLAFFFAYFGAVFIALFCRSYAAPYLKKQVPLAKKLVVWTAILLLGALAYSPLVAGSVERTENGELLFNQGPLIWLNTLVFVAIAAIGVRYLLIRVKYGNYAEKNQARFIIFGMTTVLTIGLLTNVIIPAISPGFSSGGYLVATLIMLLAIPTSYALIKHRLLDVRPLAARSLATVFLFITLGFLYTLALFGLDNLFNSGELSKNLLAVYALVLTALGFVLQPLFHIYNHAFKKLFLRKVYDPQKVINELNNVLVANLKLRALLPEIQSVIRKNLGTRFTMIKLAKPRTLYHQGISRVMSSEELAHIDIEAAPLMRRRGKQMVSLRDIAIDPQLKHLTNLMLKHRLAVIVLIKHGNTTLGTLYISQKKTELPYTNQDLAMINIIANQAGLAIQNALLFHEVSTLNDSLQERIAVATKDLRHSNTRLKAMDKAKDDFISIASHQLRTPLTTIKGYLSMLLEGGLGKILPRQREALQLSFDSSQRMSYVVSDLLNLTRLRTGKFKLNPKPLNLADIVESELSYLLDQAKFKKLQINYPKPVDFPLLMLDDTKIRQVIKNFIYNAIFYTLPGGKIEIRLTDDAGTAHFTVKDDGIGIPKDEQKHLFTQFFRATNAKEVRPDGTGVGLYISKQIIRAHHGTITFESKEGKGSTFTFTLSKKHLTIE